MKRFLSVYILGTVLLPSLVGAAPLYLTWSDNSTNEDGFKVERKLGVGGAYAEIAQPLANATAYTDTGLAFSTNFCYRLRAYNVAGHSAYSNEACGTTRANPLPAAPAGLTVAPLP